jgi:hypothetical protein
MTQTRLLVLPGDQGRADTRAAVVDLLAIIGSLIHENEARREAAAQGFTRKRPIIFGKPT